MSELLPCPFCGRESLVFAEPFDDGEQTVVRCVVCNADGPHYGDNESTSEEEAAQLWNTRPNGEVSEPDSAKGEG